MLCPLIGYQMTVYNKVADSANTEKNIKFNIYVFPTPGHMSEEFKKD